MEHKINLIGQRFSRLVVIRDTGKRSKGRSVIWLCLCDCGNLTEAYSGHLRSNDKQSCGCLRSENGFEKQKKMAMANLKHGDSETLLYMVWVEMKQRCNNPNRKPYHRYGGRGIKVCNEWFNNYSAFKFWAILSGYHEGLTIDRIDNDGNYEPNNCQWLTNSENVKKGGLHGKE